jgi:hypothetical protein
MLTAQGSPTTVEQATALLAQYYEAFAKLRAWMDQKILEGHQQGYVETMFGRKFTVWEFQSQYRGVQKKGDRMCVNAPIQGGAADYLKIGMVRVRAAIQKAEKDGILPKDSVRLFMTVHDHLEFYVRNDVATQTVIDLIQPCVTFAVQGLPEIQADWHEGVRWGMVAEISLDENKQISGYEWLDDDDVKHKADTIEEIYAIQDGWVSAKAAEGIAEIEKELAKPVPMEGLDEIRERIEPVYMDDQPDLSQVPDGTTVYPPAHVLASDIRHAFEQIEEGLRNDPEARRYHLDVAIKRGDYVLVDSPEERATPLSGDALKARLKEDTDAAQKVKAGAKRITRSEYEFIIEHGFPTLRMEMEEMPDVIEPSQTAVITIQEMPDEDNWTQFQEYVRDHPGKMAVRVETPDGAITLDDYAQFDQTDQGFISLLLGGADLRILTDAANIDITEGISL